MRKFWIFMGILFLIVFGITMGCAVSEPFKIWFSGGIIYVFGEAGKIATDQWTGIMATPWYLQWHPLIWVGATIIGAVIFVKALWPRTRWGKAKETAPQSEYQHKIEQSLPPSISEPLPENIAKAKPKQEEAVTA
jgi:hypothetical protein